MFLLLLVVNLGEKDQQVIQSTSFYEEQGPRAMLSGGSSGDEVTNVVSLKSKS